MNPPIGARFDSLSNAISWPVITIPLNDGTSADEMNVVHFVDLLHKFLLPSVTSIIIGKNLYDIKSKLVDRLTQVNLLSECCYVKLKCLASHGKNAHSFALLTGQHNEPQSKHSTG